MFFVFNIALQRPIPLFSKKDGRQNGHISRQYAVDHVLISSSAPPCGYSTLLFNGSSVHTYIKNYYFKTIVKFLYHEAINKISHHKSHLPVYTKSI